MKKISKLEMSLVAAVTLGILLLSSCAAGQARHRDKPDDKKPKANGEDRSCWALQDRGQAISKALEVFGISAAESQGAEAQVVTLDEDKTPFLHGQITKRPIWRISIDKYSLRLNSAPADEKDLYERTFDILLDPRNGKLLKIISRWPEGIPEPVPEPRAAFAEERMGEAGLEIYHSFPDIPPKISFLEALDIIYATAGNPLGAKQIVAHYVMRSSLGREPRRVWAINLRGITPFEASYFGVPVAARDHMRHIVDAGTGKWLGAGTSPQPEEPEKQNGEDNSEDRQQNSSGGPIRP